MRPALPFVLLFAITAAATAQTPSRGKLPTDGRASYSRDDRIHIPFDLKNDGPATKVVLYSSFNEGPWEESETARPGQKKGFIFKADREGPYAFATMTHFANGRTDPERKDMLKEQKVVIFDKTPPKVRSIRAVVSESGVPGIEWEVVDEYMDPKGIKLQFRWDRNDAFRPIEQDNPFAPRDAMYWQMKPADRMQVRVIATDRAGNKTESDPVWVSGKDGERGGDTTPRSTPATGASGIKDPSVSPAAGAHTIQPNLIYLNTKSVTIKLDVEVGPSGFTKATLYWADEKLDWKPHPESSIGPKTPPETNTPDKAGKIPIDFNFKAEKDGLYNFVVVVENHRKMARRKVPLKGEPGDLQVMVDSLKPEVSFVTTPEAKSNGDRGAVVDLRWVAKDANIAPEPIKLEYQALRQDRPDAVGEWKAISPNWIDNSGQYTWNAPTAESHLFLIRITCRDRAGNENSFTTPSPVNVDLEIPKVQSIDVVPGKGGTGPAPMAPMASGMTAVPGK